MCPCVPDHTPAAIAYGARLPGSSSTQPPISYSSDPSSAASASPSTPFPSRATDCSRRVPGGPICMHPLPDSDLTDAAAYDRLNRTTARKEKVLLDFVDHLAVCGIVSPHDLDNFERASLVLWRLTAVRKSLLAIHAQLDRPNPAPNNPRPLAPALQAAEEALNDVPFPDPRRNRIRLTRSRPRHHRTQNHRRRLRRLLFPLRHGRLRPNLPRLPPLPRPLRHHPRGRVRTLSRTLQTQRPTRLHLPRHK